MKLLNKNVNPGDLFYIPAIDKKGTYGIVMGRYIELVSPSAGDLIEVFSKFYTTPPGKIEDVDISERLFRPILCSFRFSEIPRWKILFSDILYEKSQSNYKNISFAYCSDLWKGGTVTPAKQTELIGIERATCWRMHHVIFRVNAHLAGYLGENDIYDYHRLPEGVRFDSPSAEAKVIDVAVKIDNLSKKWPTNINKSKK